MSDSEPAKAPPTKMDRARTGLLAATSGHAQRIERIARLEGQADMLKRISAFLEREANEVRRTLDEEGQRS